MIQAEAFCLTAVGGIPTGIRGLLGQCRRPLGVDPFVWAPRRGILSYALLPCMMGSRASARGDSAVPIASFFLKYTSAGVWYPKD